MVSEFWFDPEILGFESPHVWLTLNLYYFWFKQREAVEVEVLQQQLLWSLFSLRLSLSRFLLPYFVSLYEGGGTRSRKSVVSRGEKVSYLDNFFFFYLIWWLKIMCANYLLLLLRCWRNWNCRILTIQLQYYQSCNKWLFQW